MAIDLAEYDKSLQNRKLAGNNFMQSFSLHAIQALAFTLILLFELYFSTARQKHCYNSLKNDLKFIYKLFNYVTACL